MLCIFEENPKKYASAMIKQKAFTHSEAIYTPLILTLSANIATAEIAPATVRNPII